VEKGLKAFMERAHYFSSGYIASKLINPTRTSPTARDMEELVQRHPGIHREKDRNKLERQARVFKNTLAFLRLVSTDGPWISKEIDPILGTDRETLYSVSRQAGYWLGERLFRAYDEGRISGANLRRYAFQQSDPIYLLEGADLELAS